MTSRHHALPGFLLALLTLLAGCAGKPPPPDWKLHAQASLAAYQRFELGGERILAEREFARAQAAIARSARLDLAARAELVRCATRVASLEFDDCPDYQKLARHAGTEERAYARFLAGDWTGIDTRQLPAHHARLVAAAGAPDRAGTALAALREPEARLIAAAVLLRRAELPPAGFALAVETASEQGWRRPLRAWLEAQARRAEAAGDTAALAQLRARIDWIDRSAPR